jgi:hypothetical protein
LENKKISTKFIIYVSFITYVLKKMCAELA